MSCSNTSIFLSYFHRKLLLSLTLEYFKTEESIGERSTVIVTFFSYLVIAMAILLVDERTLETDLETAYKSFNASAHQFLMKNSLNSEYVLLVKECLHRYTNE